MSAKLTALPAITSPQPTDLIYTARPADGAGGSHSITNDDLFALITQNIADGALRFGGFAAPPVSGAGEAAMYFDSATNRLMFSENAGAYRNFGDVTGPAVATDNAIARFDNSGKIIQNSAVTVGDTGVFAGATIAGGNTLGAVTMTLTGDNTGDIYYRSAGGLLTRLGIGSASQVLTVSAGIPSWATPASTSPGGGNGTVQFNQGGVFGGVSGFTSDGANVTAGDGNLRAISPLISTSIDDANGNIILGLSPAANSVNQITIANAAASNSPVISTTGTDTNINLTFTPKGSGVNIFTKNLLLNVGSGALDNAIFVGGIGAGPVNASFGFFVAGTGSGQSSDGPYFISRGNNFSAIGNQRGNFFFNAGAGFSTPATTEGSINFFTGSPEDLRLRISRVGSTLPAIAITQSNTGEIALNVNNPSGSTVAIATFSVNSVPFFVIDSSANTYLGNGVTNAAPANYAINATGGSGTNIAGANLDLVGGKGTGNAAPGIVGVRYPLIGASGTTLQSVSTDRFPVQTNFYLNYSTTTTVANTTTETSLLGAADFGTDTIQAGLARVGRLFRLFFSGTFASTGSPILTLRLKLGGTTIATYTVTVTTAVTSWELDVFAVITAIGATGNIRVIEAGVLYSTSGTGAAQLFGPGGNTNTTIDFTASQQWSLTAEWGTANPANTITYNFSNIDILR